MAAVTVPSQVVEDASRIIRGLMVRGTWLDAALDEYRAKHMNAAARVGLCHNIAVGLLQDLEAAGSAADWVWCRGNLPGGLAHSWAEYRGLLRVDMGDKHQLRFTPLSGPEAFKVASDVTVRTGAETVQWVQAWEHRGREHGGEEAANAAIPGTVRPRPPSPVDVTEVKNKKAKQKAKADRKRQKNEKAKQRRKS